MPGLLPRRPSEIRVAFGERARRAFASREPRWVVPSGSTNVSSCTRLSGDLVVDLGSAGAVHAFERLLHTADDDVTVGDGVVGCAVVVRPVLAPERLVNAQPRVLAPVLG